MGGLALDLWSKRAIFSWLEGKEGFSYTVIEGFIELVRMENPGAAFGVASGGRWFLILISVAAVIATFGILFFGRLRSRWGFAGLGLFAAGVLGNLYDRIFYYGRVRDFIDVYWRRWHWPAFNAADAMLCVAVGLFIIGMSRGGSGAKAGRVQRGLED